MSTLVGKAKLKELNEVFENPRTDFVRENGEVVSILYRSKHNNDFIYSYEFPILGKTVDVYFDGDTYDLMPEGMEYSDDSSEALYVMTVEGLKWIVDGEVEWF